MARILVVDDDAGLLRAIKRVLADLGHVVHAAPTADAAIAAADDFKPDLLLVDWLLRERRGGDVVLAIRAKLPAIRALFITGLAADSIRDEVNQVGHCTILEKPVDLDMIEAAVTETLAVPPPGIQPRVRPAAARTKRSAKGRHGSP